MNFFKFNHNSSYETKWTFAFSYKPTSYVVSWQCGFCGRAEKYPTESLDVELDGGQAFPDFLGCGAYPFLIVSERVISALLKEKIVNFLTFPVEIANIINSPLMPAKAPKYFRIEILGECRVNIINSGARIEGVCEYCGEMRMNIPFITDFSILKGSWNGNSLFRDHRLFPRINFCGENFKRISEVERFTNICFRPIGMS